MTRPYIYGPVYTTSVLGSAPLIAGTRAQTSTSPHTRLHDNFDMLYFYVGHPHFRNPPHFHLTTAKNWNQFLCKTMCTVPIRLTEMNRVNKKTKNYVQLYIIMSKKWLFNVQSDKLWINSLFNVTRHVIY